jgi:hypothetical protein
MDYFELYYAYLAWCEKDNWANMRDPNHDYMEWNHTLPQCIFGDQPIGQWLTLKQHAIASALQTLCFNTNCLCPWHKKHLSGRLLEESWRIYKRDKTRGNRKRAEAGTHPWQNNERVVSWNNEQVELGTHPFQGERGSMLAKERNKRMLNEGRHPSQQEGWVEKKREQAIQQLKNGTHNFLKYRGTKYWVNEKGEVKRQIEKPEGEWQNGRIWKTTNTQIK